MFWFRLSIGLVNQYYGTHWTHNDKLINYSAAKYLLCKNRSKILCKLVCLKFFDQFVSLVIFLFEKCTVFKREKVRQKRSELLLFNIFCTLNVSNNFQVLLSFTRNSNFWIIATYSDFSKNETVMVPGLYCVLHDELFFNFCDHAVILHYSALGLVFAASSW